MIKIKTYCLALDLVADPESIAAYKQYHKNVWPEIIDSIKSAGILDMEIYHLEDRLCMIMRTDENFDFDMKKSADQKNDTVLKWENLMSKYQKVIPGGKAGEKWRLMEKIFDLNESG